MKKTCKHCKEEFITKFKQDFCNPCKEKHSRWDISKLNYKIRLSKLCAMAKNRAKAKSVPFDLTKEYLVSLWEESEGCCCLTGQPFDLKPWGRKGQVSPQAPSVDRIKPKLGYTKGNVRLITYHLNVALSDFGIEEFENLIKCYSGGIAH